MKRYPYLVDSRPDDGAVAAPGESAERPQAGSAGAALVCSVATCGRPKRARGFCTTHYTRWLRHGDPEAVKRKGPALTPPIVRLMARVVITPGPLDTPCWVSTFWPDKGYTRLTINERRFRAHRLSYEHFVGRIADGLVLDHLCLNKLCVNHDHLEPVTPEENTRREARRRAAQGCVS